jgi:hypothetical protein
LAALGFVEFICFEKRRETWLLDDCHVSWMKFPTSAVMLRSRARMKRRSAVCGSGLGWINVRTFGQATSRLLVDYCRGRNLSMTALGAA